MKKISKNIGWDGEKFYCRLCGKSGYDKMAQVRGHLAMCPGKAIQKGAVPEKVSQPVVSGLQLVATAPKANFKGNLASWRAEAVVPMDSQLEDRVSRLENEYNHMLIEKNTVGSNSSFSLEGGGMRVLLTLSIIGVVAYFLGRESCSCDCSLNGNVRRTKNNGFGSAMAGKIASKVIDKVF